MTTWKITNTEMGESLRGDQVTGTFPIAYFVVKGVPAQAWMFDVDLGLEPSLDRVTYFRVTGHVPTEALDQVGVAAIWSEINEDLYDVEIEQWFYSLETMTFDFHGFGIVGRNR